MSEQPWGDVDPGAAGSGLSPEVAEYSGSDTEAGRRENRFHGSVEVEAEGLEDAALHSRVEALTPVFPGGTSSSVGLSAAGSEAAAQATMNWLKTHVHRVCADLQRRRRRGGL
eukprot:s6025_g1.t1